MIIIGENRRTHELQKKLYEYYHSLAKEYGYILNHRPFIVNESLFHKIHCFVPIFEMRYLWGEKYSVADMERAEFRKYQLIHLIDILIAYDWTREFLGNIIHGSVNVRKLLVKLRSKVRYPVRIYDRATQGGKGEWTEYLEEVDSLRQRWFSLDNQEAKAAAFSRGKDAPRCTYIDVQEGKVSILMTELSPLQIRGADPPGASLLP